MKPKNVKHQSPFSIVDGMDRTEFAARVSKEVMRVLHDPACSCPAEARRQWTEMDPIERLTFVNAGLECFYWIYIARRNGGSQPLWDDATTSEKVETAAGFCSFILGTEFEEQSCDSFICPEPLTTEWIN